MNYNPYICKKKAVLKITTTIFSKGWWWFKCYNGREGIAIENYKKIVGTTSFVVVMGYLMDLRVKKGLHFLLY